MAVAGVILLKREFDTLSSDEFISFLYHYLPNDRIDITSLLLYKFRQIYF